MANDGSIVIDTRIDKKGLKSDLDSLTRTMGSAFKKIGKIAVAGVATATAAIGGMAAASVKEFAAFESGMNEVFTLLPDITEDAMKSMEKDVLSFAREMKTLPEDVVPALYQAISAGVPKDNVFDFLEVAQKAAKGGVTELETAVDGISSVVNAYGKEVIDATQASDLMFTAVKNGKTSFEEMSASLFQVIPSAAALGVEFGNVTAALATMTAQGTPTSVATTQLRSLLVELSKEGTKTSDTFKELAGKSFKDFIAEGNNLQDALKLMEEGASDLEVGINDLFGSVEAGNAALALTGQGTDVFERNLADMQNAAGATDAAYDTMNQGIGSSIESLKANFASLKIQIGEALAPTVEDLINKFAEFVGDQERVDEAIAAVEEGIVIFIETATTMFNLLKDGIETVSEIITWFKEHETITGILATTLGVLVGIVVAYNVAVGVATAVSTALSVAIALLTSPITLVVAAVGALIAIGVLLVKNWEEIKEFFSVFWSAVKLGFKIMVDSVVQFFTNLWRTVKEGFKLAIKSILNFFVGLLDSIAQYFRDGVEKVKEFARNMLDGIKNVFGNIKDVGVNIVKGLWEGIKEKAEWLKNKVSGFFDDVLGGAKKILGIKSPSVVFKQEIGENMAAGVGVGFEDQMKQVDNAVMKTLSGMASSASASVADGMRTGTNVTNNNNNTQYDFSGMFTGANFEVRSSADIKNIALEVSRVIQNQKVSRARGLGFAR